jgi:exodeoxyribonuclease VII large subunit
MALGLRSPSILTENEFSSESSDLLTLQPKKIYTVSELSQSIQALLEEKFAFLWISGEISNFKKAASGHSYFTLKDAKAQINAVMFRSSARHMRQPLKDGMHVAAMGRISVYVPRGAYQFIAEFVEAQGTGDLLLAVEALKQKLSSEGLFSAEAKKTLPMMPSCVGVITSPSGSVIRDILQVSGRRWPGIPIEVIPVTVQGATAANDIVAAIDLAIERGYADVIILARGGGSIEDLMAFNNEAVARAIAACPIPMVSAVGHETDTTIADLVADMRAPTPSAAAELVFPAGHEQREKLRGLRHRLEKAVVTKLTSHRRELSQASQRLRHPHRRITDSRLRLDDLMFRAIARMQGLTTRHRELLSWRISRFNSIMSSDLTGKLREKLEVLNSYLLKGMQASLSDKRNSVNHLTERINDLSPLSVLRRGYSITRSLPEHRALRRAEETAPGERVEIQLAQGRLEATITETSAAFADGQENFS